MSNLNPGGLTRVLNYIKTWVTGLLNDKANSSHTHTKSQITDFPTIPTVNNATLTIQKNGTTVNSFTANASSNVTANISVPTKTSDLTNDSGYITSAGSCSYSTTSGTSTYSTYLNSLGSQTPKSGRDIFHSGVYTYTTFTDTNTPAHYGAVIGYGNGQGGSCEMFAEWVGSGQLWFRVLRDWQDSWTSWQQIITSGNIGSQSVNYANSAGSVAWGNVSGRPTVNNATLTIQKNGTNVATFTSNASSNVTANISVPTNTNQLTNGAGYITSSGSCNYANSAGKADYLGDIGSTDRNSASGTGWYSVGFSYSYDEGHNELAINNYWGIRFNCRDSAHVTINGSRINVENNTYLNGYKIYVG